MITKNELAQACMESYSPSTYKKSQLTEGNRRNKQSLYGMSQFNIPEDDTSNSNTQADASWSELDVQDIMYEFYANKRNPTSADIAKLEQNGIWTIPTVDCYWGFFNEAAKHNEGAKDVISQYDSPQALYAYLKKHDTIVRNFLWLRKDEICKSKYMFVDSIGAVFCYIGYRKFIYSTLVFKGESHHHLNRYKWPEHIYDIIKYFITGTYYSINDIKQRNANLDPWIKTWWEDTYGIQFNF